MVDNKGAIILFADRKSVPGSNAVSAACVSDEALKTLEELCEKTGMNMSSLVRTLIEDSLELVKVVEA